MSQVQKSSMKSRWETCDELARILGTTKIHVHNKLYSRIKEEQLLETLLEKDPEAINLIKTWPEFTDLTPQKHRRPTLEEEQYGSQLTEDEDSEERPKVNPLLEGHRPASNHTVFERIKIGIWFAEKMGGTQRAIKVLELLAAFETE